jgi:hypothetical protein
MATAAMLAALLLLVMQPVTSQMSPWSDIAKCPPGANGTPLSGDGSTPCPTNTYVCLADDEVWPACVACPSGSYATGGGKSVAACLLTDVDPYSLAHSQQLGPGLGITWEIKKVGGEEVLVMGIEASATGWVGFGIAESGGMKGADIVYYEAQGNKLVDAFAIGNMQPQSDLCQDWYLYGGEVESGVIRFLAQRLVNTHDESDWPIWKDGEPPLAANRLAYVSKWSLQNIILLCIIHVPGCSSRHKRSI